MNLKFKKVLVLLVSFLLYGCNSEPLEKPVIEQNNTTEEITEQTSSQEDNNISEQTTVESTELETISENEAATQEKKDKDKTTEQSTQEITADGPLMEIEQETNNDKPVSSIDTSGLPNEKYGWYFNPNNEHKPPTASDKVDLAKYDAYYLGDTSEKTIYLTFDEGYENGYSTKILDVLKEKDVKAAFFVTKSFIKQNQDLIKRMTDEGHVVGNHSVKHKSLPDLTNDEIVNELLETADYYKEVTGKEMPKVFRPPMGEYSERTLAVTKNAGYKSIFWSFAYKDWLTDQQPGKQVAYDTVMKRYHNGAIMLLHAVSQSNTEALGDIIDSLRAEGYNFKSLTDL